MSFFQGNEWIILLLVAVLLIWGPTKLPQLARGLGKAFYEFRRATQGLVEEEEEQPKKRTAETMSRTSIERVDDETLAKIAEKLGVNTSGKTRDQIIEEVVKIAKEKGLIEKETE